VRPSTIRRPTLSGRRVVALVGGLTPFSGLLVRPAGGFLAADMVGAVATAGARRGRLHNLGVAPMLFVAMSFLVSKTGGGSGI
jgi:hypothetical protein